MKAVPGISTIWSKRCINFSLPSKICGIVGTIFFRWKSRNAEMFSEAVPLFDITGRPGTFDVLLCILGNK